METTIVGSATKDERRLKHALFYTRLALYLLVFSIPLVHPAIVVPYDALGWWLWFALLPAEMLIAFYAAPPRLSPGAWLVVGALPIAATIAFVSEFSPYSLLYLGVGAASFLVTAAVFHGGPWGRWLALPEPFLLAVLYFKMLSFTRASETIAEKSAGITQLLLVVAVCAFLLHSLVLYFAAFRSQAKGRRELLLFACIVAPVVLAVAILVPANFVSHSIVLNDLDRRATPRPFPIDASGNGIPGGNLRSAQQTEGRNAAGMRAGDQYLYGDGQTGGELGKQPLLEGVPSNLWQNGQSSSGSGQSRQYAVMVVASPIDPVYAADGYFGLFDPQAGFERTPGDPLNDLVHSRLLDTWTDGDTDSDADRTPEPLFFLSTIPDRVLAYRPYTVEPTVLKRAYYPFSYSYDSTSMMSLSGASEWSSIVGLSPEERAELAPYLAIPLSPGDQRVFEGYLARAVPRALGYFARIQAILRSFSSYQYQVGFSNDVSVAHLVDFLTDTKNGDCVEFSNTAAVLGRLMGIPSRVVTGYLAAKSLQTPAHRRGLEVLREKIPLLKAFPMDELYLVTTAHRHSWVQYYLPGYGWVDFESTAYAIPPAAGGDPDSWDVVIPLLNGQTEGSPLANFPWRALLEGVGIVALLAMVVMYLYRYGRELFLLNAARGRSNRAPDALYKLLLLRLVNEGFDLKSPAYTPGEYAAGHPELARFAALYTEIRYRELFGPGERKLLWAELRREYRLAIRSCRGSGVGSALRRGFSLKGLYYRW